MVDYSRFREIEADDDDVAQAKVAKHNESMHVIHELLRRVDPDVRALHSPHCPPGRAFAASRAPSASRR